MGIVLFDTELRYNLLPFTHTRPVADIRCGIFTMRERWEYYFKTLSATLTENYLQAIFPATADANAIYINGSVFANMHLAEAIKDLQEGQKLVSGDMLIAFRSSGNISYKDIQVSVTQLKSTAYAGDCSMLKNPWDIFSYNDKVIREDYQLLTRGRKTAPVPGNVIVTGTDIFIEEGASIGAGCIINTISGPVYIGKDAEILEGTMIRGPLAMCEHSVIKMGGKIYGATTLGPGCKVGGEINNAVFFANSNKAHDGYLGNAVIGEWCNLGADTNCSNLKNNYDEVKIWDEHQNKSIKTGLMFCGLLMGDHSKAGINTMFNTGTVVGASCNIFGGGFPPVFIPSFCWGGNEALMTYRLDRAVDTANRMMGRRHKQLSGNEKKMLEYVFETTAGARKTFTQG